MSGLESFSPKPCTQEKEGQEDLERYRTGIGTYTGEALRAADTSTLRTMLTDRIKILSTEPVPIENLFTDAVRNRVQGNPGKARTWKQNELLQFALLLLDGKTSSEIALTFNEERESESIMDANTINVLVHNFFTPVATALAHSSVAKRRTQDFLFPVEKELRKKSELILKRAKVLKLSPMSILSSEMTDVSSGGKVRHNRKRSNVEPTIFQNKILIELLYARFCEGMIDSELRALASKLLGYEVGKSSVGVFFNRALSEEAKTAFGIGEGLRRKMSEDDFRRLASCLVEDELIRTEDIARIMGRKNDISYRMKRRGEELLSLDRYKNDSPIVAFLLEYGKFPEGTDPRTAARRIEAVHSNTNLKLRILKKKEWSS